MKRLADNLVLRDRFQSIGFGTSPFGVSPKWGSKDIANKKGHSIEWPCIHDGGDEGDRTPDLLTASQALSQLSYAPVTRRYYRGSLSLMQELFWVESRTYGFSWDGAEIITLRAIISIRRPDKTLMRWPLLVEVGDSGTGVDLDPSCGPGYVADARVSQEC